MNFIEIILIALSLSVDSFAVSVGGGISMGKARPGKALGIASVFGMMQAGLLAAGCLFGVWIESYIGCFSGYLGFFLLLLIGGSMVMSFFKKENEPVKVFSNLWAVLLTAVATSIDASAVGLSQALAGIPGREMAVMVAATALCTLAASFVGVFCGSFIGSRAGRWAELAGGAVLISIGVKILISSI